VIAIDWGTSSFRAYRLDRGGRILEKREAAQGILSVAPGTFGEVLEQQIGDWDDAPILMSGMVGSRQGWREAPYVQCPAGLRELSQHFVEVRRGVWIVPGVSYVDESGVPDVMRGEETQVLGVLDELGDDALVCLPGTHSKWVRVRGGRMTAVRTHFTGEMFAVLKAHSLLGRMIEEGPADERAFAEGIDRSGDEGGLLHHIFGVRTRGLFGVLGGAQGASYLSGLLIGHELRAAPEREQIHILAAPALAERYACAASLLGRRSTRLDSEAAPRGLFRLAREIDEL
jgi:2-dehydro-3-deoxygalactonokinase